MPATPVTCPPHPLSTAPAWQALLPVGEPSDADFRKFASLITRHRQVSELKGSMGCATACLWPAGVWGCQPSHAALPTSGPASQVKLNNVRTFHHAAHKSPFKHIPWKSGHMNFKFLGVWVRWAARG